MTASEHQIRLYNFFFSLSTKQIESLIFKIDYAIMTFEQKYKDGGIMHYILFELGPIKIYSYGFMIALGFILCILLAEKRCAKYGLDSEKIFSIAIWGIVGGLLGAKILYYITDIKNIIEDPSLLLDVANGFVVYGGIIGGVIGGALFVFKNKLPFWKYFDLAMPSVSLAQGFGRLGCFLAGCCFGRETDSILGVVFHDSPFAPNGVKLLPTQLFSSAGDFIICFILCMYARKSKKDGTVGAMWLLLYSVGRFVIECFRNDPRGEVGSLSTSQFISIFMFVIGITLFVFRYKKNEDMN